MPNISIVLVWSYFTSWLVCDTCRWPFRNSSCWNNLNMFISFCFSFATVMKNWDPLVSWIVINSLNFDVSWLINTLILKKLSLLVRQILLWFWVDFCNFLPLSLINDGNQLPGCPGMIFVYIYYNPYMCNIIIKLREFQNPDMN